MRYIIDTAPIKEPGSIGTKVVVRAHFGVDTLFRDLPRFGFWRITRMIDGWVYFAQRCGRLQDGVDELIASGGQVCTTEGAAPLVRWFSNRPLPMVHDYELENLGLFNECMAGEAVTRWTFDRPIEFANRRNLPERIVIFADSLGEARRELARRIWAKDVPVTDYGLRIWDTSFRNVGTNTEVLV